MRQFVLVSLCAVAIFAFTYVNAEECTVNSDCGSTGCADGFHVICQHPSSGVSTNGGLCTCAVNDLSCTSQSDCQSYNVSYYTCLTDGHKHCYDNKCICTRWR